MIERELDLYGVEKPFSKIRLHSATPNLKEFWLGFKIPMFEISNVYDFYFLLDEKKS